MRRVKKPLAGAVPALILLILLLAAACFACYYGPKGLDAPRQAGFAETANQNQRPPWAALEDGSGKADPGAAASPDEGYSGAALPSIMPPLESEAGDDLEVYSFYHRREAPYTADLMLDAGGSYALQITETASGRQQTLFLERQTLAWVRFYDINLDGYTDISVNTGGNGGKSGDRYAECILYVWDAGARLFKEVKLLGFDEVNYFWVEEGHLINHKLAREGVLLVQTLLWHGNDTLVLWRGNDALVKSPEESYEFECSGRYEIPVHIGEDILYFESKPRMRGGLMLVSSRLFAPYSDIFEALGAAAEFDRLGGEAGEQAGISFARSSNLIN